ncbi:hypothetical protein [Flavobacterium lacus]|uniref:Uncharacterized protein n=1 Tax=Flavobacterium lacus TaxID=1353778 RepID=A0A328WT67_9FLAO|nr:hypothetical protein [Flavobacterium lacus]RAR47647.1 hypothetical protein B0I10_108150 [Flavobacterium lacus]
MKKIICFTLLLSFSLLNAQGNSQLKVTESAVFKDEISVDMSVLAMHTTSSGKTGLLRANKNDFLVDVFDKQLTKIFSKVVESNKKESFDGYVSYGDEIKYITVLSPSKRERIVYCNTFNIENKTHSKKELFKADVEKGGLFTGRNKRGTNVAISPNGKYIAIATDNIKKNLNSYKVHVFDSETLRLVFEKSYQEDADNYFEPNDLFIDNNATVYPLGKLFFSGKSQKKEGNANYEFVLNKLSKDTYESLKISLEKELLISSLAINYYENKLNLVGFYSNERAGNIKGGCNFEINTATFSVISTKNSVLPKDVYDDLYGDAKAERNDKKKKELRSFYVDYIIRDDNGNTFLLAEEFFITQTYVATGMNGGGYWTDNYHYDDILILKFDKTGAINWGRSIFKRANSPSYNAFLKDDKLHVLLNSGKNLTEKQDGRTKVSKGWFESSALYDFTYSVNGEVEYNKIQDNKGNNFYVPFFGTFNNNIFIMMSDGVRKKQFMILE